MFVGSCVITNEVVLMCGVLSAPLLLNTQGKDVAFLNVSILSYGGLVYLAWSVLIIHH